MIETAALFIIKIVILGRDCAEGSESDEKYRNTFSSSQ